LLFVHDGSSGSAAHHTYEAAELASWGRNTMNWLLSLLVGVGVGILYGLLDVRSPAPPLIALLGLLGMLGGEYGMTLVRRSLDWPPASVVQSAQPSASKDAAR
jgi:XapX domain-containing protein